MSGQATARVDRRSAATRAEDERAAELWNAGDRDGLILASRARIANIAKDEASWRQADWCQDYEQAIALFVLERWERFDPARGAWSGWLEAKAREAVRRERRFLSATVRNSAGAARLTWRGALVGKAAHDAGLDNTAEGVPDQLRVRGTALPDTGAELAELVRVAERVELTRNERRVLDLSLGLDGLSTVGRALVASRGPVALPEPRPLADVCELSGLSPGLVAVFQARALSKLRRFISGDPSSATEGTHVAAANGPPLSLAQGGGR